MSLFGLTKDYMQVKMAMDSMLSDDVTTDTEAYEMTLESIKTMVGENSQELAMYVKELEATAETQEKLAADLKAEAEKNKLRALKVMDSIATSLKLMELNEVQAGAYKFKFKKGSEVTIVDESQLPDNYWVEVPPTPPSRKPMAKNDLKKLVKQSGITIPGVEIVRNPDKLELK